MALEKGLLGDSLARLTHARHARSIKALRAAEKHYLELGYDPTEAMLLIYDRALAYYDSVFPEDEKRFRAVLVKRREEALKEAAAITRRELNQ